MEIRKQDEQPGKINDLVLNHMEVSFLFGSKGHGSGW